MVSEGRKVAGFHCSSFTGSQGQAFLLVWLGGEHFLKGQGGGDTQPHQAPGSSPAASPSGSQSGPGNPSKEDRLVPHSTWPGRTHLPPRKQPPSETQRKRLTVPGLAFRAALSPRLRSPPRFIMADSPCPVGTSSSDPIPPPGSGQCGKAFPSACFSACAPSSLSATSSHTILA